MAGRYNLDNFSQPTSTAQTPAPAPKQEEKPWITRAVGGVADVIGGPLIELGKDVEYGLNKVSQMGTAGKIASKVFPFVAGPVTGLASATQQARTATPEQQKYIPDIFMPLSESPTVKKIAGDLAGSALTVGTLGWAGELKAGTALTKYAPKLSGVAERLLNRAVTNGLTGAGFEAASALSKNKSFKDAVKDTAVAVPMFVVGGEALHGLGNLAKMGLKGTMSTMGKIAETSAFKSFKETYTPAFDVLYNATKKYSKLDPKIEYTKSLGQSKIETLRAKQIIDFTEQQIGLNFKNIKNYKALNGKTYTGAEASFMAEVDHYKYNVNPFTGTKALPSGTPGQLTEESIRSKYGQLLKRMSPEAGQALQQRLKTQPGLITEETQKILNDAVGYGKGGQLEINNLNLTPKEIIDLGYKEIAGEAAVRGVKTKMNGKWIPFTKLIEENYAAKPMMNEKQLEMLVKGGAYRDATLQQIMTDDPFMFANPEKANKYIDDYLKVRLEGKPLTADNEVAQAIMREKGITWEEVSELWKSELNTSRKKAAPFAASLERANTLGIKVYHPNPKENFLNYIDSAVTRFNFTDNFGGYNPAKPTRDNWIYGVKQALENDESLDTGVKNEKGKLAQQIESAYTTVFDRLKNSDSDVEWMEAFNGLATYKLTASQILQMNQAIVNSSLTTDLYSTVKGVVNLLDKAKRDRIVSSGVTGVDLITQAALPGTRQKGSTFLKTVGFQASDQIARLINGSAAEVFLKKHADELLKNPTDTFTRSIFEEVGLNPDTIIKQGGLKLNDVLLSNFMKTAEGQFLSLPGNLPKWMSSSWGKIIGKFQGFGFQQMNLALQLQKDFAKGGKFRQRALKNLFVMTTIAPISFTVADGMRDFITGGLREMDPVKNYIDSFMQVLGTPADIYNSFKYGENPLEQIITPVGFAPVTSVINIAQSKNKYQTVLDEAFSNFGLPKARARQLGRAIGLQNKMPSYPGMGTASQFFGQFTKK